MPVISFDYNDFISLLGFEIPKEKLIEHLPMIGGDFDSIENDTISIEFFPNRPDLTSVEGIARAARAFFGFKTGLKTYPLSQSDVRLHVDSSVKTVRPFVATALLKNVTMTDELIASLMDLQEKLHYGIGRNRQKVAIGVHNFEPVTPPFTYKAVDPDSVSFIPLARDNPMTLRNILKKHEKGKEYAFILDKYETYPLIVDKFNNVLSFPPIINGLLTEVTPYTSEIFIDVTGTDQKAIHYTLNIISTALAERKAKLYTTTVVDTEKTYSYPNLSSNIKTLSVREVNNLLGTKFSPEQIIDCLHKMGYNAKVVSSDQINVEIPPWRADILHEYDLIEDVAIGYGYDNFTTELPTVLTFGKNLSQHPFFQNLRTSMIGLQFNEVTTFSISNAKDEFNHLGLNPLSHVSLANPIGEDYSMLRVSLLPSLLKLLRQNRHHPLPQQIFEIGIIVDNKAGNRWNLAALKIDAKANFTECKSYVETLFRNLGKPFKLDKKNHPAFISGRCAQLICDNAEIGFFGELHPRTILNFDLDHPVIGFELQVSALF